MMTIWDMADSAGNVTLDAVAEQLGADRRTVLKWVDAELLPARKHPPNGHPRNSRWVFRAVDVERFERSITRGCGPQR